MNNYEDWSDDDLQDKFIEDNGWKRKYGIAIQTEMINDDYPEWFFPEEMQHEVVKWVFRWQHEDIEQVYEDCDILDAVEEHSNIDFEDWKKELFAISEKDEST